MLLPRHGLHRFTASILCIKLLFFVSAPTHANCLEKLAKEGNSYSNLIKPGAKFLLSLGVFSGVLWGITTAWAGVAEYDAQINTVSYKSFQCHPDCYYSGNCNGVCLDTMSNFTACQEYMDRCLSLTKPRGLMVLGAVVGTIAEWVILGGVLYWGRGLHYQYAYQARCNENRKQRFEHLKGLYQADKDMTAALNNLKDFYVKSFTKDSPSKLTILDVYLYLQKGTETDELCPNSSIMGESHIIEWLEQQKPLNNDNDYKAFAEAMKHSDEAYNLIAFHACNNAKAKKALKYNNQYSADGYTKFIKGLKHPDNSQDFNIPKKHYYNEFGQQPNVVIPMGHDSDNDC